MNTSPWKTGSFQLHVLVLVIIGCLYYPTIHYDFVYDDLQTVAGNPYIKDVGNIPGFFDPGNLEAWSAHPGQRHFFRPLALLSFAANYAWSGLSPESYRILNILLHIVAALLLFHLICATEASWSPEPKGAAPHSTAAFFAALLFAVHPIQTESVIYVVSRSVIICSIFILAGLIAALNSLKRSGKGRLFGRILSLFFFFLALLSKETAIVFPLLLICLLWTHAGVNHRNDTVRFTILESLPALILLAVYLVIRVLSLGHANMSNIGSNFLGFFMTAAKALFIYLRLFFLPIGQNVDHHLPLAESLGNGAGIVAVLSVVLIYLILVSRILRKPGFSVFWLAWFFVAHLPSLLLPTREAISEHSIYLPSMGLAVFGVYALTGVVRKRWHPPSPMKTLVAAGVALAMVMQLSFLTLKRNRVWQNPLTLWSDSVRKNGYNSRAQMNLGTAYLERGAMEKAKQHLQKAIELQPDSVEARNNLGAVFLLQGRYARAGAMLRSALFLNPKNTETLNNLGYLRILEKRYGEAARILAAARKINPRASGVSANLGLALIHLSRRQQGCRMIRDNIRLNPDDSWGKSLWTELCRSDASAKTQ